MKCFKKLLSGALCVSLTLAAAPAAFAAAAPEEIIIDSVDDLMQFAKNVNTGDYNGKTNVVVSLEADLDLSGVEWTPIGYPVEDDDEFYFSGKFLGNGHTVSNIDFTECYENGALCGFFGDIEGGEVSGLTVTGNVDVQNGGNYVFFGTIAGVSIGSIISDCVSDVDFKNNGKYVYGTIGMVGYALDNTAIEYCENKGNIEITGDMGSVYVGGVAAYVSNSTVQYSANTGDITSAGSHVGGVAGELYNGSKMNNCYSIGKFAPIGNGTSDAGGLTGTMSENSTITNSFFAGEIDLSQYTASAPFTRLGAIYGAGGKNSVFSNNYFTETENITAGGGGVENIAETKTYEYMTTEDFYNEIVENGGDYRFNAEGTPLLPLPKYEVTFLVNPAELMDCEIKLDGEVLESNTVELSAGEYTVEVEADGYQPLSTTVTITADTATHTQVLTLTLLEDSSAADSSSDTESSAADSSEASDTSSTDTSSSASGSSASGNSSTASSSSKAGDSNPTTGGTASVFALLIAGGALAAVQVKRKK